MSKAAEDLARAFKSRVRAIAQARLDRPWNDSMKPTLRAEIRQAARDLVYERGLHRDVAEALATYAIETIDLDGEPLGDDPMPWSSPT